MAEQSSFGGAAVSTFSFPQGIVKQWTVTPGGSHPQALAFDSVGNLFVPSFATMSPDGAEVHSVIRINPGGQAQVFATLPKGVPTQGVAVDSEENVYVAAMTEMAIYKVNPDGSQITKFAALPAGVGPRGLAIDRDDNLYVADIQGNQILKITPAGQISTFAHDLTNVYGLSISDTRPIDKRLPSDDPAITGRWVGKDSSGSVTYDFHNDGMFRLISDSPQLKTA